MVYLDDILVFSPSVAAHKEHLHWTLSTLRQLKMFAKRKNCTFGETSGEYLGHIVSGGNVDVDPAKTAAVRDWPSLTDVKAIQQFTGLANDYNRFVPSFAQTVRPLMDLLCKGVDFVWGEAQEGAFELVKRKLTEVPVLALPDMSHPFVIYSDASNTYVGAMLSQDYGAGL